MKQNKEKRHRRRYRISHTQLEYEPKNQQRIIDEKEQWTVWISIYRQLSIVNQHIKPTESDTTTRMNAVIGEYK